MARFYKTAKPTFVDDAMYEAPYELMLNALKTQDKLYDDTLEPSVDYSDLANETEYVDKDKEDRDRLLKEQSDVIEGLASKIQQNPALASVYKADLAKARKDYETLITSGGIHEMDRAAKNRAKAIESTNKKFQLNQIDAKQHAQELEKLERDYTGWAQGGKFADNITSERFVDTEKMAQNLSSIIKAESVGGSSTTAGGDGYLYVKGSTNSYIKKDRLEKIIDTDPEFKQWAKAEEEKYLRDAEAGIYGSEEEALEEFEKSKADHRFNLIDKLVQNTRTSTSDLRVDQKYYNDLDEMRKQEEANNYDYVVDVEYEELDDDVLANLIGVGLDSTDTYYPSSGGREVRRRSNAEKAIIFRAEHKELNNYLNKKRLTPDSFQEKMKTREGRNELLIDSPFDAEQLARQANYFAKKKQSFQSVGRNLEGTDIEVKRQVNTILQAVSSMPDASEVSYSVSVDGKLLEEGKSSLGGLGSNDKNLIKGFSKEVETEELIPLDGGFANKKGEVLMVKDPNDPDKEVVATRAQALAHSDAKLQKGKKIVEDTSKNILHGKKQSEVQVVEEWDYRDGIADPVLKEYYVVPQRNITQDQWGREKVQVVTVKIPKSEVDKTINVKNK